MSSSRGGVPTPADALEIMEEPVLRWLYARRRPAQSFTVAFDAELLRLYDEWDAAVRKVAGGTASDLDRTSVDRAVRTAAGELPRTPRPLPYRTLASVADITTGDPAQTLRILTDLEPGRPLSSLDEVRPRLDRAQTWVATQLPADERTRLHSEPDRAALAALDSQQREALKLLTEGLDENWSLEGLSGLVYAVPKVQAGLTADAQPTPELKAAQRSFFALIYQLLIGKDTGPRLPTLLLAAGQDRVRDLLGG
jgi:lysyl-tRNA synthetase class 1